MTVPGEKIALFIDGANLYATAKSLGFDIDYKKLLREFQSRGYLLRAFYYTAVIEDQEYSSIRPLIDWLDYNGYSVVTKATKEFVDQTGRRKVKGNMDIELAVDAMEIAGTIDHMVLFSGDGDFRSLVEAVQRQGVRVTVISTISTQPPMVADELRRQADIFIDIVTLQGKIGRDPSERPARPPRDDRAGDPAASTPQFLQRLRRQRRARARLPLPAALKTTTTSKISRAPCRQPGQARPRLPALPAAGRLPQDDGARASRDWFNAPVPSFGPLDARLLIVGLAPGLQGANRTGRPFTGDYAGDLLYETLARYGFARGTFDARADDGLELVDCRITNAVRCVPPENKPTPAEIKTCRDFLSETIAEMPKLRAIVALGRIAHDSAVTALGAKKSAAPFKHGGQSHAARFHLFSSYHCSRYNTNTGVLTPEMFRAVFAAVRGFLAR